MLLENPSIISELRLTKCRFLWMMPKDNRYIAVNSLIASGEIKTFNDIFNFIPKKVVYEDMGINYLRFRRLLAHPDLFTGREMVTLAKLIGCDKVQIFNMATAERVKKKKGTK